MSKAGGWPEHRERLAKEASRHEDLAAMLRDLADDEEREARRIRAQEAAVLEHIRELEGADQ